MNGDLQDAAYTVLQLSLGHNIQALMDNGADFNTVWDYDSRDAVERICQIVGALASLERMSERVS